MTYRYREFPVPGNFSFFWWYRNRYRKQLVPEKSFGTGIGKIWYRKKVSEPVSEKFGTGKKSRNRYRKNLVPEKSLGTGIGKSWYRKKYRYRYRKYLVPEKVSVSFKILGTVTHWYPKKRFGSQKNYSGWSLFIGQYVSCTPELRTAKRTRTTFNVFVFSWYFLLEQRRLTFPHFVNGIWRTPWHQPMLQPPLPDLGTLGQLQATQRQLRATGTLRQQRDLGTLGQQPDLRTPGQHLNLGNLGQHPSLGTKDNNQNLNILTYQLLEQTTFCVIWKFMNHSSYDEAELFWHEPSSVIEIQCLFFHLLEKRGSFSGRYFHGHMYGTHPKFVSLWIPESTGF